MISVGLTLLSTLLALLARRPSCWLAAAAMGVCALGDALLAGYPDCFAQIKNRLIKGGSAFLAAHILYIGALLLTCGMDAPEFLSHLALPFAVFFAVTILHSALFYFRAPSSAPPAFFAAAFLYLLVVGLHAGAAIAAAGRADEGFTLNAAGAILFYLSDAILLARKYGAFQGKHITALIWLSYVPAQLCLMTGFYLG